MKKPKFINLDIVAEKIIPGGQTISTLPDGKKIILWNILPGEKIKEARIVKQKSNYLEGIATKFEHNSDYRIEPKDNCYLSTSPWQIFDYNYELNQKNQIISELFNQHHLRSHQLNSIITDNKDLFYRNKMEYSLFFDHSDQKIHLGFHLRGTHQKIPIQTSSIELPSIFNRATEIITELNKVGRRASDFQSLILRSNQQGEVSGGLLERYQPHPKFKPLNDTILGQNFTYSPNGFFQINLPVYEKALEYIKSHINTKKVLDLYAGVGSIGLSVASDKILTLVEINESAYQEMQKNCGDIRLNNNNPNIKPILAKSEDSLDFIEKGITVILDPPRAGCDLKLLEKLLNTKVHIIIYMSCNPATLARDLKILESSYEIIETTPFNFFPRTPHIESVTILKNKYIQ